MRLAENLWLSATATQRGMSHMMHYSAAFYGTAALQAWKLGLDAPMAFWQAVARAGETAAARPAARAKPRPAPQPVAAAPAPTPVTERQAAPPPATKAPKSTPKARPAPAAAKATAKPASAAKVKAATPAKTATLAKPVVAAPDGKAAAPSKAVVAAPKSKPAAPAKPAVAKAESAAAASKAKAETPAAPKTAAVAAPEPANSNPHLLDAPRGGQGDDLTVMSGVGEKLALVMNDFGIYHFDQIAGLTDAGIDWLNAQQPGFKAVIKRFDLVGQAKALVG